MAMLRVYCSRYISDWDRVLPQMMGAYNSTQHSTPGISPHMMLTGHEKALPLTFFYPEYQGRKSSPQVYVRNVIRRQQDETIYGDAIRNKLRRGKAKRLIRKQLVQGCTQ